jgi:hypothetical protein
MTSATKVDLANCKDKLLRHFNVVTESIYQDVAAAGQDEISSLKNQTVPDLERRAADLEEQRA